jgi:Zn-dependent protease with chaperone function
MRPVDTVRMHDPVQPSVIGPADLEDFRSAQRRHRRSARLRAIPAILAAAVMGIPLGVYLSPVLLALSIVLTDLLNLVAPMPDIGGAVWSALDRLTEGDPGTLEALLLIMLVWVIPGIVLLVVLYLLVRWRLGALGGEGLALGLGGRAPHPNDPEEVQVVDVVTELAVAAGIRTPAVMLYDEGPANALVFGRNHDDATVLVARRLLDDLDREATQGVVARLLASAGDGDLGLAVDIAAVYVTYGLVSTMIVSVVSPSARRRARGALPPLIGRRGDPQRDATAVATLLGTTSDEDVPQNAASGCLTLLTMGGVMTVGVSIINLFLSGPLLTFAWRSRGYLADAAAVDLTRNPDALARALRALSEAGTGLPGCGWLELLLVVGGGGGRGARTVGGVPSLSDTGFATSLAPPVLNRLARLRALGAQEPAETDVTEGMTARGQRAVVDPGRRRFPGWLAIVIIGPLIAIVGVLLVIALALMVYLAALAAFIVLAIIAGPLHELLRGLAGR